MSNDNFSEPMRCWTIIAVATAAITVIELLGRAFFYEQAQQFVPYLPLLIGSIALCATEITRKKRYQSPAEDQPSSAGTRRVRVTGPIK